MAPSGNPGFRRSLSWGDVPEKGRPPAGHRMTVREDNLEWDYQIPPRRSWCQATLSVADRVDQGAFLAGSMNLTGPLSGD